MLLKTFIDKFSNITNSIDKFLSNQPYWIEITTKQPQCIYYFGPFESREEAKKMQYGYIEDLMEEKAIGISIKIQRCLPTKLTITEEDF